MMVDRGGGDMSVCWPRRWIWGVRLVAIEAIAAGVQTGRVGIEAVEFQQA